MRKRCCLAREDSRQADGKSLQSAVAVRLKKVLHLVDRECGNTRPGKAPQAHTPRRTGKHVLLQDVGCNMDRWTFGPDFTDREGGCRTSRQVLSQGLWVHIGLAASGSGCCPIEAPDQRMWKMTCTVCHGNHDSEMAIFSSATVRRGVKINNSGPPASRAVNCRRI